MKLDTKILQEDIFELASNPELLERYIANDKKHNFNFTMINIERECLVQLKKQEAKKRKLNVSILVYHRAHWAIDSVYNELINSGFNVQIIITPAMEIESSLREQELENNYNFFKNLGYNVIRGYDFKKNKLYDLEKNLPDIIFYQTHWMWDYPEQYNIKYFYNKALCIGIPYGFYVANIQQYQFNEEFQNLVWLNFAENIVSKQMAEKYADNDGCNVVLSGYPKMDNMYNSDIKDNYWKTNDLKRIIWAPHYSINTEFEINYANFHLYYQNFFDFVKNNKNIEMIMKPHPMLKSRCIQTKTLTEEGYDNYLNKWNNLYNGSCVIDGNYMNLFKTSDGMILDSLSFIAEYLYTKKPICFINKFLNKQELLTHFNEFGQIAIQQCYIAQNWQDIEKFVNEVVIGGNDYMKPAREEFYDKYLKVNEGCVGKYIADYIKTELGIK